MGIASKIGNFFAGTNLKFDPIEEWVEVIRGSDTYSFYLKEIPAVILSSGGHSDHHTPEDKINMIEFDHLHVAAKFLYLFIMELANAEF